MTAIGSINGISNEELTERTAGSYTQNQVASTDEISKQLQSEIQNKQIELQKLSSNDTMEEEEKMQKRQDLLKEVNRLNAELRQRQLEEQRKKREDERKEASQDSATSNNETNPAPAPMTASGMEAMVSADTAIRQAVQQGGVAAALEGRTRILESEIEQDAKRGISTQRKEDELENVSWAVKSATSTQLGMIGQANNRLTEAISKDAKSQKDISAERRLTGKEAKARANGNQKQKAASNIKTPNSAKQEQAKSAAEEKNKTKNSTSKLYSPQGKTLSESMGFSVSIKA